MSGPSSRLRYSFALLLALQALTPLPTAFAQSYRDIAKEAALKGENEKAVVNFELALSSATKLFDENDIEIVIRRGELGEAYRAVGRWKEAIEQLDYAWRRSRYDAETNHRWSGKEGDLAFGFAEKLGRACQASGRYDDAVMAFETNLSDAERTGRPAGDLIAPAGLLADTLLLLQREEEADKAVARALAAARKAHANEPPALARDLTMLAQIYHGQLRYAKALPLAHEALALAEQNFPDESRDVGLYQSRVGALMVLAGEDDAGAKSLLEKSRENLLKKQTRDAVELLLVELSLARLASRQGEFDLCQKHTGEAWRICRMHFPSDHPETGRCYRQLADNFTAMEMSEDAAGLYAKALAIFEAHLGKDHPLTAETHAIVVKAETQLIAEREQAMKEKAMVVAEQKARIAAEEKAKADAAEKVRMEAEEKARMAAAEKARIEEEKAQLAMKAKQEAEEKVRKAAEEKAMLAEAAAAKAAAEKAKLEEEKAMKAAQAKAAAEEKARLAAEEKTRMEEAKAKKAAEEAKMAEAAAAKAAEEKALKEEKARVAAEEKAKVAAEQKARMAAAEAEKEKEEAAAPAPKKATASKSSKGTSEKNKKTVASSKPQPKPKPKPEAAPAAPPKPVVKAEPVEEKEKEKEKGPGVAARVTKSVTGVTGAVSGAVTGAVSGATDAVSGAVTGTVKKLFNRKKSDSGDGDGGGNGKEEKP